MLAKRCLRFIALGFTLCAFGIQAYAQRPAEATASVPELISFHDVIYKIWHEAWPKKNTAMLQQLLPEVEKRISGVASAQLPGILRDRKSTWEEGVKQLQSAGSEYKAAAAAKDDAKLLAAAEALHARFERLMRAIRPALKELDEFHAALYMLYHHYLPKYEIEKIRSSAGDMKLKMAALNEAQLPERLQDKDYEFKVARGLLSMSVGALESAVRSNDEKTIRDAVEEVHSRYQALEKIF